MPGPPNTDVVGTLTLDPARVVNGKTDPIVALRLTKNDGTVIGGSLPSFARIRPHFAI